jgi:hypothetical protein
MNFALCGLVCFRVQPWDPSVGNSYSNYFPLHVLPAIRINFADDSGNKELNKEAIFFGTTINYNYVETSNAVADFAEQRPARDNIYVSAQNMVLSNSNPYCSMASLYNSLPGRVKDIKNLEGICKGA